MHTNEQVIESVPVKVPHRGALRWCKRCSRRHRTQEMCALMRVKRTAKSGKQVFRYAHVKEAG